MYFLPSNMSTLQAFDKAVMFTLLNDECCLRGRRDAPPNPFNANVSKQFQADFLEHNLKL